MNLDHLQQKLLVAARSQLPGDHVPYAFEKRILARLVAAPALDHWALWARALWRAAAPCVALTLLLGVWSSFVGTNNANTSGLAESGDLSQHFEQTMLAAMDDVEDVW
jgi:hypothetical protein